MSNGVMSAPAMGLSDLLQSNDGLAKVAALFESTHGRELSPDALQVILFLQQNGSPDLARELLGAKRFQSSAKDIIKFTESLSPATAHMQMLEAQAKARKDAA